MLKAEGAQWKSKVGKGQENEEMKATSAEMKRQHWHVKPGRDKKETGKRRDNEGKKGKREGREETLTKINGRRSKSKEEYKSIQSF